MVTGESTAGEAVTEPKKPWCYDRLFENIRRDWDVHDKTCMSLRYLWLGHSGGVSCPSDLTDCSRCGATFYNEGVTDINWDSGHPDTDPDYRCECCARPDTTTPPSPAA
jgi:hypothetical protein